MKKYRLRLKDEHKDGVFNGAGYKIAETLPYIWLSIKNDDDYSYYQTKDNATVLTMEDIDGLPYGFIKKHRIFEVKEQIYYIKLPYLAPYSSYINYFTSEDEATTGDYIQTEVRRTKFTKKEIEDKFPNYANNIFMVKVEDVE